MKDEKYCHKCGKKLKRIKTKLMTRAELSHPEDPYDGAYKPLYFYVCNCWREAANNDFINEQENRKL